MIVLCDRGHQSEIVATDTRSGLASLHEVSEKRHLLRRGRRRLPARAFVSRPDTAWIGRGTAFSAAAAKRRCTLLAVWYVEQEEPWIILTDLPGRRRPDPVGMRFLLDRVGLQGGQEPGLAIKTRRTDPARISRHWLVLSVATLLTLAYGTRVEDAMTGVISGQPPEGLWRTGTHRGTLPSAGPDRQRHPLRHRLAEAVAAPGPALEPILVWLLPEPLNPSPTWRSPAMPLPENPIPTPVSPARGGRKSQISKVHLPTLNYVCDGDPSRA